MYQFRARKYQRHMSGTIALGAKPVAHQRAKGQYVEIVPPIRIIPCSTTSLGTVFSL